MPIEPRSSTVTIYTGNFLDEIRHLERQAVAAKEAHSDASTTIDESPAYLELAARHDALVAEAEASAVHIKVEALPRSQWKALVAAHPPRTVEADKVSERVAAGDAALGVNEDTFKDALVPASIVFPELSAEELDQLSDMDFDRVYFAAFSLNRGTVTDPKGSLVSRLTQTSDET